MAGANNTPEDVFDDDEDALLTDEQPFVPHSKVPMWIQLNASPNAIAVWAFLKSYIGVDDQKPAFPARTTIAAGALKTKDPRTVDRYLKELVAIGAITKRQRRSAGNMRLRNIYRLAWFVPAGFSGPVTRKQWEDMNYPVAEEVKIYRLDEEGNPQTDKKGNKRTDYSVVRYSALRADQAKHPDTGKLETDKTENPWSARSAPQRTTLCATAHPGSAPQRTGITSKGNTSNLSLEPAAVDTVTPPHGTGPEPRERLMSSETANTTAVNIWRTVLGVAAGRISDSDKKLMTRALSEVLASGADVDQITDHLRCEYDRAKSVYAMASERLKKFQAVEGDLYPQWDAFVPEDEPEGPQRHVPAWCGRCSSNNSSNPKIYRRTVENPAGEPCPLCHPDVVGTSVKESNDQAIDHSVPEQRPKPGAR